MLYFFLLLLILTVLFFQMGSLGAPGEGQYGGCTDTHDHLHQPGPQVQTPMIICTNQVLRYRHP